MTLFAAVLCLMLAQDVQANKLHLIGAIALKKAFKVLRKNPIIPVVIPLPILRHPPRKKEVWKVEEHHGWQPQGWH